MEFVFRILALLSAATFCMAAVIIVPADDTMRPSRNDLLLTKPFNNPQVASEPTNKHGTRTSQQPELEQPELAFIKGNRLNPSNQLSQSEHENAVNKGIVPGTEVQILPVINLPDMEVVEPDSDGIPISQENILENVNRRRRESDARLVLRSISHGANMFAAVNGLATAAAPNPVTGGAAVIFGGIGVATNVLVDNMQ